MSKITGQVATFSEHVVTVDRLGHRNYYYKAPEAEILMSWSQQSCLRIYFCIELFSAFQVRANSCGPRYGRIIRFARDYALISERLAYHRIVISFEPKDRLDNCQLTLQSAEPDGGIFPLRNSKKATHAELSFIVLGNS